MSKTNIMAKIVTTDAKEANARRFRNILANSGDVMESGEIRDIKNLYVMGYNGELFRIADLNPDPEKQTEEYSVKAQADHGKVEIGPDGEAALVPSIEKQFGSCRVWLEKDGLHARMYFADNDQLADHAWAISQDASYSIGTDWYPDGYYGIGYEIEEPIGILREISMVLTGNDPRAKTIDHKATEAEAQGRAEEASDTNQYQPTGDSKMSKKLDELTPDERRAFGERFNALLDEFTADVPEDETEPTADEAPEAEEATKEEAPKAEEAKEAKEEESKEETKDGMPFLVIKEKDTVKQENFATKTTDWLYSQEARKSFADTLHATGEDIKSAAFQDAWRKEVAKHQKLDGITGLPLPVNTQAIWESALERPDGIVSHFRWIGGKSLPINILSEATAGSARAQGHKDDDTKVLQALKNVTRNVLNVMVYKKLDLTAMQIYNNPELIQFRAEEIVDAILVEIARAAISGDGRTAPSGNNPDLRMFRNGEGFYSMAADAAQTSSSDIGTILALTLNPASTDNSYDKVVKARHMLKGEGRRILVATSDFVETMELSRADGTTGQYLIQPGASVENFFKVDAIYTPDWMDADTANDAYLFIENRYGLIGEQGFRNHPFFDTEKNVDNLLIEAPRGGSLLRPYSAVAISKTAASGE